MGRIFAIVNNYNVDGNKEMIAFGMMNIVGSMTSCLFVAGIYIFFYFRVDRGDSLYRSIGSNDVFAN